MRRIDRWRAYQQSYTSKGYYHIAGSWILDRTIGDKALYEAGYNWIGYYYSASTLLKSRGTDVCETNYMEV